MKYLALCAALLLSGGVARAAAAPAKALSIDFNLKSSGPASGKFLGTFKLTGTALSGTFVDQAFGYVYTVSPGSSLQAHVLTLTATLTSPPDSFVLTGKLNPLTGKGKGTFTESFFGESGTYKAKAER